MDNKMGHSFFLTHSVQLTVHRSTWVRSSSEVEASGGEKTGGESLAMEDQETTGPPLEAVEPPLGSSHGMSFWMFIVVRASHQRLL